MAWLSLPSLAWLGLLAPLVLLYVLKRRRVAREVPSTWLWEAALRDLRAERPWKRLIVQLALILQALAIVLGALALARPVGAGSTATGARIAVVIDASVSMQARLAGGGTRLSKAQQEAVAFSTSLPPGGDMTVIEACGEPTVIAPPSRDAARLAQMIRGMRARCVHADLAAAIALAQRRLKGSPVGSRIVVWSDLAADGDLAIADGPPRVELRALGADAVNTGIVALDVRSSAEGDDPDRAEIFARVAHTGARPRDVYLTASTEERGALAARKIRVTPNEAAAVTMDVTLPPLPDGRAPILRLALSEIPTPDADRGAPFDDFPLDDVACAPSPGSRKLPVFLVGSAPAPVVRVFQADAQIELYTTTLEALATSEVGALDGLIVYTGATPDHAPQTDSIVIAPEADRAFEATFDPFAPAPRVVTWDESDPRMRFVSMRDVWIARARPIRQGAGRPLVVTDRGAIVASLARPSGETTWIGFDPAQSDWPSKPSFVVFFRNLIERARARRAAKPVALPGPNLLSPEESDLRPRLRVRRGERALPGADRASTAPSEHWRWVAMAMLLALAAEAWWATRKEAA